MESRMRINKSQSIKPKDSKQSIPKKNSRDEKKKEPIVNEENENDNENENENEEYEEDENENEEEENEDEDNEDEDNVDEEDEEEDIEDMNLNEEGDDIREDENFEFIDEIIKNKKKDKPKLNIVLRYFQPSDKGFDGLMKKNLQPILQRKHVDFEFGSGNEDTIYYLITGQSLPKQTSDIYGSVKKTLLDIDEGFIQNCIFLLFEEVSDKTECKPFKSENSEMNIIKLYVQKPREEGDQRRNFMVCIENTKNLEKIGSLIHTFYELKMKEFEEIQLQEANIEENENEKINKKIFSPSVILKTNEVAKLFLKNPSMNIKLILKNFRQMMSQFPEHQNLLCEKLMDLFKDKDPSLKIENERAIYADIYLNHFGKETNLNQFSITVANHMYQEKKEALSKFEEGFVNKMKENPLKRYLVMNEYKKKHPLDKKLFKLKIENNYFYPSYALEDILVHLFAQNKEKIRVLIPFIVRIHDLKEMDSPDEGKHDKSSLYLISYLFYDDKRIYLYPLYFLDTSNQKKDEHILKYKKTIIDNISVYLTEMIKNSILHSFVKIQFGGVLPYHIPTLMNDDILENMNEFLIVYFQLFYGILNKEYKPNEILQIFDSNDLNDHFYVFLQFLQEVCIT